LSTVARNVHREFLDPGTPIIRRRRGSLAPAMPMPEAPVYEDRPHVLAIGEIGRPRQIAIHGAVPDAEAT
jgi:hypothetical protein